MLACPSCGESLTTEKKNLWVIAVLSVVAAIYATRHLLYRDSGYLLVTDGLAFVFFFIGAFLLGILVPPKYKRVQGESFDNSLSLFRTDRPDPGNKSAQK
jgi:hypothetical protein